MFSFLWVFSESYFHKCIASEEEKFAKTVKTDSQPMFRFFLALYTEEITRFKTWLILFQVKEQ